MRYVVLSSLIAAGCGAVHPSLPPPPPDAAAKCDYHQTPEYSPVTSRGTTYFDATGRVIRIDGFWSEASGDVWQAPYYFTYDDQGRLAAEQVPIGTTHYDYTPEQITQSSDFAADWIYTVVDGRVSHEEGPIDRPVRNTIDYTYDDEGRITGRSGGVLYDAGQGVMKSSFDIQYTLDSQGRIATVQSDGATSTLTYTDTANRLVVDLVTSDELGGTFPEDRWTIDYDATRRIVRLGRDDDRDGTDELVATYTYGDGEIDEVVTDAPAATTTTTTAIGMCAAPSVTFAFPPPLPFRADATSAGLVYQDTFLLLSLDL